MCGKQLSSKSLHHRLVTFQFPVLSTPLVHEFDLSSFPFCFMMMVQIHAFFSLVSWVFYFNLPFLFFFV